MERNKKDSYPTMIEVRKDVESELEPSIEGGIVMTDGRDAVILNIRVKSGLDKQKVAKAVTEAIQVIRECYYGSWAEEGKK